MRGAGCAQPFKAQAALLAVLLAGFFVAAQDLGRDSLSYDEAVSAYLAGMNLRQMVGWTAQDVQPPLYYAVLHGWTRLVGGSEFSLRYLSAMCHVLAAACMYRLAALFLPPAGALFAASACAFHPWYLWHAQDARMYSLLLLEGVVATWRLLAPMPPKGRARHAACFSLALLYAAMLYTHYLSAALIGAHLVLALLEKGSCRQRLREVSLAIAVASLVFLPWLPLALQMYRADASYYTGPPKWWELCRKLLLAFFTGPAGQTVQERAGVLPAGAAAALLGGILVGTLWAGGLNSRELAIRLVALLVACLFGLGCFLAFVPKFNERYFLQASLVLPLMWALPFLLRGRLAMAFRFAAVLGFLAGAVPGVKGLASGDQFAKPDFRGATRFILSHLAPQDAVFLCSGHIYPVWMYYAPGYPYVALPQMRVLSLRQRLSLATAAQLLAGELRPGGGAWVLAWQQELADPSGSVLYLLEVMGKCERLTFGGVTVLHCAHLHPERLHSATVPAVSSNCRFGSSLRLLGTTKLDGARVALHWEALQPLDDYRVAAKLLDGEGNEIYHGEFGLAGDEWPTHLWPVGEVTVGTIAFDLLPGTLPGQYTLALAVHPAKVAQALTVYDEAGNPQGELCRAAKLWLEGVPTGDTRETVEQLHLIERGESWDGLELIAVGSCPQEALVPGAELALPALWRIGEPDEHEYWLRLEGDTYSANLPARSLWSMRNQWPAAERVIALTPARWFVPADAPAAQLRVAMCARQGKQGQSEACVYLCQVNIQQVARTYALPQPALRASSTFDGFARFLGADATIGEEGGPARLTVVTYWQALRGAGANYSIFVHLVGPDGRFLAGVNSPPAGGARPTAGWLPGEVIAHTATVPVPDGIDVNSCELEVGMFRPELPDMPRAPVTSEGLPVVGNALRLPLGRLLAPLGRETGWQVQGR